MNSSGEASLREAIVGQRKRLARHAEELAGWLVTPEPLWSWQPSAQAWSVAQVLAHVALTQHFLLLLIDKLARKALAAHARGAALPTHPSSMQAIDRLAQREFHWDHPAHMTPVGAPSRDELALQLAEQTRRCLAHLDAAAHGEGALARTRMSVVDAHLDLYQYLHLLDCHAARHLQQLERNRAALAT